MILVTGASGNLGTQLTTHLDGLSLPYVKAMRILTSRAKEQVLFDFQNVQTFKPALKGCNTVFLLRPPAISNTKATLCVFIDVARNCGVKHIVFVSVAGVNWMMPHFAVEQKLKAGPRDWTILRPDFFMQNLEMAYRTDIRSGNKIYLPCGKAKVRFIDASDVSEVASRIIKSPTKHLGKIYTLSGPEALSFQNVAAMLSTELGRPIQYISANVVGYIYHLFKQGLAPPHIVIQTILHLSLRFKGHHPVNTMLETLLARSSTTMQQYMKRERKNWL
jgi:uncharacterized protein YbjT (DUF2867 family)